MRHVSVILGIIFVLTCLLLALIQGWVDPQAWAGWLGSWALAPLEQVGYFSLGWGTGVTGWLVTGHWGTSYLSRRLPWAWKLWRKNVLVSLVPVFKYLVAGVLLLGLGAALGYFLWGIFTAGFDIGLAAGAIFGLLYTARKDRGLGDQINLLEANQRYLNKEQTPLFQEE